MELSRAQSTLPSTMGKKNGYLCIPKKFCSRGTVRPSTRSPVRPHHTWTSEISPSLCFKARLSAMSLIWKWFFFIIMQLKLVLKRKCFQFFLVLKVGGFRTQLNSLLADAARNSLSNSGYYSRNSAKTRRVLFCFLSILLYSYQILYPTTTFFTGFK